MVIFLPFLIQRGIMTKTTLIDYWDDISVQYQMYMQSVRQMADAYAIKHGTKPRFCIKTFGCQMNEHDSEKLNAMLVQMGYLATDVAEEAQIIIYNTCCVRENAELKVFGHLGSLKPLKLNNKDIFIAVCGCMMQQPHIVEQIKKTYSHVDLVFGTHNLHTFPRLLQQALNSDEILIEVWQNENSIVESMPVTRKKSLKAFVNIMYGCNNFCTFCIVPYTRGRERSRLPKDILKEVKQLIKDGVKEIMLLGQNVNSYGFDFVEQYTFPQLLTDIDAIAEDCRIRFMTPHPKDLSPDLIDCLRDLPSVCEYIHLPVQAGSDGLLKHMNRKYTRQDYLDKVALLKQKVPNVAISTDIIIGFPGETEADVDALINLIEIVQYDSAFTFIYSRREGTPAAKMPNQIDEKIKHRRFDRMLKALNDMIIENNKKTIGQQHNVLVEAKTRDQKYLMGRTRNNKVINFSGDETLIGQFVDVEITDAKNFSLYGKLC